MCLNWPSFDSLPPNVIHSHSHTAVYYIDAVILNHEYQMFVFSHPLVSIYKHWSHLQQYQNNLVSGYSFRNSNTPTTLTGLFRLCADGVTTIVNGLRIPRTGFPSTVRCSSCFLFHRSIANLVLAILFVDHLTLDSVFALDVHQFSFEVEFTLVFLFVCFHCKEDYSFFPVVVPLKPFSVVGLYSTLNYLLSVITRYLRQLYYK